MDFAYWLQIVITLGPMLAGVGILYEKVRQLENRLGRNGDSVPSRCRVHEQRLETTERRLEALEESG